MFRWCLGEDNQEVIIKLFESSGRDEAVFIDFESHPTFFWVADETEQAFKESIVTVGYRKKTINFPIKAFENKIMRLYFMN